MENEAALLASCYHESLTLAVAHDVRTIAFPAISCGVYGYPIAQAAHIAIDTTAAFLRQNRTLTEITMACFGDAILLAFQDALGR